MTELPPGWHAAIDGERSAVYEYDPGTVSIEINHRSTTPGEETYRVELKRHSRLGTSTTVIASHDTMPAAKTNAHDVITTFANTTATGRDRRRFRSRDDDATEFLNDSFAAISATAEALGYSSALLREHLQSLTQDGLRAAFILGDDEQEAIFLRDDVRDAWTGSELREALASVSALQSWEDSFAAISGDAVRSTAVLLDSAQLYKGRLQDGPELIVSIDYDYQIEHPLWIEECRVILRQAIE